MEDEQIRELAIGLEQSGDKFIWVLRDAGKANVFNEVEVRRPKLPLGFDERVKGEGVGMVVREWLEILGRDFGAPVEGRVHEPLGVELMLWNSCLESMSLGVPLAAWPTGDQPMNAALVTKVLKAGIVAREWARREELVS